MQNVRIWFSKTGAAKYISHLDLTRCMARALKLSGLPVWYTQGYNPRIYMTFAMPLSLGVSGLRECVDIRLIEETNLGEATHRLAACLPEDIHVLLLTQPEMGFEEAAYGEYELRLEDGKPEDLAAEIRELLAQETVTVMKHGKKGDRAINIKPYFSQMQMKAGTGSLVLEITLPCSLNGSVNPGLLLDALKTLRGLEPYGEITRKRLLTKDFSDMR